MKYLPFGSTGMQVSRLTLGGMNFGVELDPHETRRVVDEAIDCGVNCIDTAESYGPERESERYLGQILKGRRDRLFLATKVHTRRTRSGYLGRCSRANLIASVEGSLQCLQTDHLDLVQMHHPDPETPLEESLTTLDRLIGEGKIRHYGLCNHYAWQVARLVEIARRRGLEPPISLQYRHNILDRPAESEIVPCARHYGLATMIYGPLCGGMLTGKYCQGEPPPEGTRGAQGKGRDLRHNLQDDRVFALVDALKPIAMRNGLQLPQLAVLWLLSKPEVTTVLLGGSRREHYQLLLEIADRSLPKGEIETIDQLSMERIYRPFLNQPQKQGPPASPLH